MEDSALPIAEHLTELKGRLIKSVICLLICAGIVYTFSDEIIAMLARPIGKLVFIAPQEAFMANIKIAFWGGLFVASPFIITQAWQFIAVGLKPRERRLAHIFAPISFMLFLVGAVFCFLIIVPIGMRLLLSYSTNALVPMITVSRYISFVGTLTLAFGVFFQLPMILFFLTRLGIVTPEQLSKNRRYVIVAIFIVAAIFTPPDVITQICLAIPLLALNELGILLAKVGAKK